MKLWKILGALLVVAALGGTAFGAAAMLNVNSQGVQAGSAPVTGCQGTAPVSVSYGTHFSDQALGFVVDSATVSGIVENCFPNGTAGPATDTIHVVLTTSGGGSVDLGTMGILGPSVMFNVRPVDQFAASSLTDVHVAIN